MKKAIMSHIVQAAAALFIVYVVINFLYWVLPVNITMSDTLVRNDNGNFVLRIVGRKLLDCQVVGSSEVGYKYSNERGWQETHFEFEDDMTPGSSKPVAWWEPEGYGLWHWNIDRDSTHVRMTLIHVCSGTPRTTKIGPFNVRSSDG